MSKTRALRRLKRRESELRDQIAHLDSTLATAKRLEASTRHLRQSLETMINILVEQLPDGDLLQAVSHVKEVAFKGNPRSFRAQPSLKAYRAFLADEFMYGVVKGDLSYSVTIVKPLLAHYMSLPHSQVWKVQFDDNVSCYAMNDEAFARMPTDMLVRIVSEQIAGHMRKAAGLGG